MKAILFACFLALGHQVIAEDVEVEILSGDGAEPHHKHPNTKPFKAFDGMTGGKEDCYLSGTVGKDGGAASAEFLIEEAVVKSVSVLNRPDIWYGQQAGMKFQVCDSVEGTCQDCIGSVQHPQQNAWSTIECNSLQGDTIEVSGSITIDICEMIVKGELTKQTVAATEAPVKTTTLDTTTEPTTTVETTADAESGGTQNRTKRPKLTKAQRRKLRRERNEKKRKARQQRKAAERKRKQNRNKRNRNKRKH